MAWYTMEEPHSNLDPSMLYVVIRAINGEVSVDLMLPSALRAHSNILYLTPVGELIKKHIQFPDDVRRELGTPNFIAINGTTNCINLEESGDTIAIRLKQIEESISELKKLKSPDAANGTILKRDISVLHIPRSAVGILHKHGIYTIEDLIKLTPQEVYSMRWIGQHSLNRIQEVLSMYGLTLKGE